MNRNKKIFIFLLIFLAAIVTAFLIYYFFSKSNGGEIPPNPSATFPKPTSSDVGNPPQSNGGNQNSYGNGKTAPESFKPVLRQITTVPTASGTVFERDGKSYIRYIERVKGNVYETDAISIKAARLSNTTIPQVYEAFWSKTGSNLIARFLKEGDVIQTFSASVVPKSAGQGELRGEFLTSDIKNLALSPSKTQIFYLVNSPGGSSGIATSFDGKKKIQVFDSPLREWIAGWPKEDTVTVTSKAGAESGGLMMFVNTATGKRDVILSGINGLTTLTNADGSKVLYSVSSQNTFSTNVFDAAGKTSIPFAFKTLPEKCVWSQIKKTVIYCAVPESLPAASYPDLWYQGITSFRDEIWKIDTATGTSDFIMNLGDQSRIGFDAISPALNSKENFLLLTNKNDLTLWELQIAP